MVSIDIQDAAHHLAGFGDPEPETTAYDRSVGWGRENAALLELEKTSRLVTVGLYRYIRHPLYSSLLFLD